MQLPARIGKYELQELLGGGMARVYKALDTVIGRTVAVKILTEEGCADEEVKSRFLQEARLAGNVTHDNIISIYDFGEDAEGRPFMVMEFLKGQDLKHAIKDGATGDVRNKLRIALDIARSLEHIHTQSIIHRDIKPDNVHITTAGAVKLMDFGISKMQNSTRTTTGVVMGTPYYMAPEQVLGRAVTPQVDVYAFGVLLFELMTGSKPIVGDTVERIFYQILQEPLNIDPMKLAGVPEPVISLVRRCTEKDPAQRPQGFGEVCAEIQRMIQTWDMPTEISVAPRGVAVAGMGAKPAAPAARKPWMAPAIVVAIAIVLAGVYFGVRSMLAPAVVTPVSKTEPPASSELRRTIDTTTGRMVLVAEGSFLFGKDKQSTTLPAFYIDKTEVPYEAYERFSRETGLPMPAGAAGERPRDPMVDVSFLDAQEFAKWAGKRLPTSQEWEKAARGTDGRVYPWGDNQLTPAPANIGNPNGIMQVGSHPAGASPYGAVNMLGNVWEWVDDRRTPSPEAVKHFARLLPTSPTAAEPWYAMRGASYQDPLRDDYLWDYAPAPARYHAKNIGFRCVKNP